MGTYTNVISLSRENPFLGHVMDTITEFKKASDSTPFALKRSVVLVGSLLWKLVSDKNWFSIQVNGSQVRFYLSADMAEDDFILTLISNNGYQLQVAFLTDNKGEQWETMTSKNAPSRRRDQEILKGVLDQMVSKVIGFAHLGAANE
jgi:hypothetical protein